MTETHAEPRRALAPSPWPRGGGELGALIRAYDWSTTDLGPIEGWSAALRTATDIVLQSPVPLVMLWGPNGIMIYNDAYSGFAGKRHPRLLGSRVLEGWAEVADFNARVLEVGLSGGTLSFENQELTLWRNNVPEQVWMNLNYGPVLGDDGRPAGVLAIVMETTRQVAAERALAAQKAAIEEANRRLSAETGFLRELFEQAPSFMSIFMGPEHRVELANRAFLRLVGERDVVGKPIRDAMPEVEGQGFFELLDEVFLSGRAVVGQRQTVRLVHEPGAPPQDRIVDQIYQPIRNAKGEVIGIFVEGQDVTEHHRAEQRVRRSEARFRALVNATADVVYRMSPDWREIRHMDGRGFLADVAEPSSDWADLYLLPEDRPAVLAAIAEAVAAHRPVQIEHRVRRADGTIGWTFSRAVPLTDETGAVTEWFGAASDVTARRQAEDHLRLVVNELNHRVKNTLAMVQAIGTQTFRNAGDLAEAQASYTGRILALARANDLLTGERWVGASLATVIRMTLEPHVAGNPDRLTVGGPPVALTSKTALSLSMALHELATNAVKHGAWSVPGGLVEIVWTVTPSEGVERLDLAWRERDGPPVSPPDRRGFGSRLVERGLAAELGGEVQMAFRREGLVCTMSAPLVKEGEP